MDNDNMLLGKLKKDIENWEGQEIEFIEDFPENASDLAKEIAAFATSNDAIIYLGVDKNREITGLSTVNGIGDIKGKDNMLNRLAGITQKSVRPSIIVIQNFIDIKDKNMAILRIDISKGIEPVYYSNDIPWIRNLSISERASPDQVKELHRRYFLEQGLLKEVERPFLDFRIMKRDRDNERLCLHSKNITNTTAVGICIEFIGEYFQQTFGSQGHIRTNPLQKDEGWRCLISIPDYNRYDRSNSKIIVHYKDMNGKEYIQEVPLNHIVCSPYEYPQK